MAEQPKVAVITPVLNGERYLAEAIESVLAQRYDNWTYVVLDNHSVDGTRAVVEAYAHREPRLRLSVNNSTLPIMQNWNVALQCMPADAVYCKVLHADDWMEPDCLARMVGLAERHPTVAIVSSYVERGGRVDGTELPPEAEVLDGREVCRQVLLDRWYPFGSPSALLMRADLVRARARRFYDPDFVHADLEACYDLLRERDFGFVHEVLTHRRLHGESMYSTLSGRYNTHLSDYMALLWRYGPVYLDEATYRALEAEHFRHYRRRLARRSLVRGHAFWRYHKDRMATFGYRLGARDLLAGLGLELAAALRHPSQALSLLERAASGRPLPTQGTP